MKTKKALAGLLGLFGSFAAFFEALVPAPAPFLFSLASLVLESVFDLLPFMMTSWTESF